jgi:amidase
MAVTTEHRIGRDEVIWAFGPDLEPVLEVDPGAVVTLETNDCFTGQIQTEDDLVTEIDFARVNSATGPIAVRGAEPGDSLVVELLEVRTGPRGFATLIPGIGQLIDQVRAPYTQVFEVDGDTIRMNERISFSLRPMVGVIGVATDGETLTNGFAGRHGGNLDNHLHGPGATVYLPVRQPGGMLAIGDMHASMGDGEVCFTGVEIAGEVTIRVDVLKAKQGMWPVTELRDRWVVHGTAGPDFMEALDRACEEAARFLVDQWGFTMEEAFVFLSVACDANICQACRPQPFSTIARIAIPKIAACPTPFNE